MWELVGICELLWVFEGRVGYYMWELVRVGELLWAFEGRVGYCLWSYSAFVSFCGDFAIVRKKVID